MDGDEIRSWFSEYLQAFAACGRGASEDLSILLRYYGVPLVLTTDDAAQALTSADEVVSFTRQQIAGLRAARYDHSDTLNSEVVVLNKSSALYTAEFSRQRADGTETGRLRATYLIAAGAPGLRIFAVAVRAP